MIESAFRTHASGLQKIYDAVPFPLHSLLTSMRGWFLTRNRYSPEMYAMLRRLRSHEYWDAEQIAAYQLQCLRQTTEHARETVPFYTGYPQVDWRSSEDLEQFPILTRDVVQKNSERFVSKDTSKSQCIWVATTGTTGASLKVAYSSIVACHNWAFRMRHFAWAGVTPRHPRVTLFGSRVVPPARTKPPYWTHNLPEGQVLMSIFHLSESAAPHYIAFLHKHQGEILEGFPSVLGILADFILQRGEAVRMRAVFTDGEPLYPFLRQKIEKVFQSRVYNCYGNTELCGLIQECECRQMHLAPEYGYAEILDENNRPVPSGQEGYLVWTSFINQTMPLIRYRIGDRACWQRSESCPCGRAFPLLVPTITRESDLLRCPDGRVFSPRALNQALKGSSSFRFCQFVQDRPGHVAIRAVPNDGNAVEELVLIRESVQRVLGRTMQVTAELASQPLLRAGGKIPLIVQQVR